MIKKGDQLWIIILYDSVILFLKLEKICQLDWVCILYLHKFMLYYIHLNMFTYLILIHHNEMV